MYINTLIVNRKSISYHRRKMKLNISATTIFALVAALGIPTLALKENCIEQLPLTIYEASEMSPQNMDFDMENNVSIHCIVCLVQIRIVSLPNKNGT